jgi:ATP-dependent RNA helicase DeaD
MALHVTDATNPPMTLNHESTHPMSTEASFEKLGLPSPFLQTLATLGYETPTPIQSKSIPILLEGADLIAQAQTGRGKTAAFALPVLSMLDLQVKKPQALVIAPTRELAIQVAEAFQSYAKNLPGFHVAPIYGGQDYQTQLRALKRGLHVVVGTPGRVMDHLRRGSLSAAALKTVVLDEGDEMLRMGFIDDVEWILEQIPHAHQTALFSATLPLSIQKIAKRYLKDAKKVQIKPQKNTVDTIEQSYIRVAKNQKLEVLTRFLEVEDIQAALVFTRTKNASAELAEKLQARGHAAAALNGDMSQSLREKVIERIKGGSLDIIVATDVAARGIDVDRITHVINYDIPYDEESYIHRIGRTGRAGRKGKALLFVTPREYRLLRDIERAIHQPIKQIEPPSLKEMSEKRNKQLAEKVLATVENRKKLKPYHKIVKKVMEATDIDITEVAAALVCLIHQANPLPSNELEAAEPERSKRRPHSSAFNKDRPEHGRSRKKRTYKEARESAAKNKGSKAKPSKAKPSKAKPSKAKPSKAKPSKAKQGRPTGAKKCSQKE